jgi:hypothetical protein
MPALVISHICSAAQSSSELASLFVSVGIDPLPRLGLGSIDLVMRFLGLLHLRGVCDLFDLSSRLSS